MTRFNFGNLREKAKEAYKNEINISRGIQDEVKIFNERFPKHLEPLGKLSELIEEYESGAFTAAAVGEFSEGMIAGDSNEEKAWSYFLSKGFNKKAIAGILGNFQAESGISPTTIQSGGKGPGTGLIQWENGYSGRWNQLEKWATQNNKDKWDMETQLDYLWLEMTNGSHNIYWKRAGEKLGIDLSGEKEVPVKKFGNINNIEVAMKAFELTIERAGIKAYPKRLKYANEFYEKYKDWDPSTSTGGAAGEFGLPHRSGYTVTSEYGNRLHPIKKVWILHAGIDLVGSGSKEIYLTAPGKIVTMNPVGVNGLGNHVIAQHGVKNNKQIFSLYAHLTKFGAIKVGQTLNTNTVIGIEGTTGASTGVHLHFEMKEASPGGTWSSGKHVNPRNYVKFK